MPGRASEGGGDQGWRILSVSKRLGPAANLSEDRIAGRAHTHSDGDGCDDQINREPASSEKKAVGYTDKQIVEKTGQK